MQNSLAEINERSCENATDLFLEWRQRSVQKNKKNVLYTIRMQEGQSNRFHQVFGDMGNAENSIGSINGIFKYNFFAEE